MIKNFLHRGLKRLYERGNVRGLPAEDVERIRRILARLDASSKPSDMGVPGSDLHPLHGDRRGTWAVTVRANWSVIFRFEEGDTTDVDYLDYH